MSIETPNIQNAIRLVKFYVSSTECKINSHHDEDIAKDVSIQLNVSTGFREDDDRNYVITFKLDISSKESNDLEIKIIASALFETESPMTHEFRDSHFVKSNSPAIAFPFLRSFVNTLTTNSGISPILLPSFNFSK
ncbi:MAG: protein-export chaperone SecB [Marinilabiliaceae bacterium]|nr:protein-export chaperone SecB [Marinilabiliaceae bacterium]